MIHALTSARVLSCAQAVSAITARPQASPLAFIATFEFAEKAYDLAQHAQDQLGKASRLWLTRFLDSQNLLERGRITGMKRLQRRLDRAQPMAG